MKGHIRGLNEPWNSADIASIKAVLNPGIACVSSWYAGVCGTHMTAANVEGGRGVGT